MQERATVTRQEMRNMRVGQTRIFTLADKKKIMSVRVQANQLKNEEDLEFEGRVDELYENWYLCELMFKDLSLKRLFV